MGTEGNDREVEDAWACYKTSGSQEARNWLMVHYVHLVKQVASKVHAKLMGHIEQEDLVSYGMFGLADAIEKFSLERGAKFDTYARARIQGQMYDEVRKLSWVPRNVLSRTRDLERAREELEALLGRPAEHKELAEHMGLELLEYWRLADQGSVLVVPLTSEVMTTDFETFEATWNSAEIDHASNPEDAYQVTQVAALISEAVAHMDARLKTIIALYYLYSMTLGEIGEVLGVTGGRVCQLQSRALTELQDALSGVAVA